MFLLILADPGSPGQRAFKWLLLCSSVTTAVVFIFEVSYQVLMTSSI